MTYAELLDLLGKAVASLNDSSGMNIELAAGGGRGL